jgi:hypothetical protein
MEHDYVTEMETQRKLKRELQELKDKNDATRDKLVETRYDSLVFIPMYSRYHIIHYLTSCCQWRLAVGGTFCAFDHSSGDDSS